MTAAPGLLGAFLLVAAPVPTPTAVHSRSGKPRRTTAPAPARAPAPSSPAREKVAGIRAPHSPLAPGDRISLDLKDADIRDVIRTFAQLARIHVVIDPEVRGSVTVCLTDVAWEDALDVILRSNGLGAVSEGNLTRVAAPRRLADEASQ